MKEKFLLLTTMNDTEILVGINNIISIEGFEEHTSISFNANTSNGQSTFIKTVSVKTSFNEIKSTIGF